MSARQYLWTDESAVVISVELAIVATLTLLVLATSLVAVRDAIVSEISDLAGAVQDLHQSYAFHGSRGHSSQTSGSDFLDATDWCDVPEDRTGYAVNCIVFNGIPFPEM